MVIRTVAFGAWSINRAIEIFDHGGLLLTRRSSKHGSRGILDYLRAVQWLSLNHGIPRANLFLMRPKCHFLWHTAVQTLEWELNPFIFDNFAEESWLGQCKKVAKHCHGKTMTHRVMDRYLLCLGLFLENYRRKAREWAPEPKDRV